MNGSDKDTYRKQIASLKNGTARQMEIAHSLSTLLAEVERLTVALYDDAATKLGDAMLEASRLRREVAAANEEITAMSWDIAGLRYYVEALESRLSPAARRVAAGEARAQLEQHKQGEAV